MNGKNIAMGIVVIAVIAIAVFALGTKPAPASKDTNVKTQPTTEVTAAASPSAAMMKRKSYKDGTYQAIGDYVSPAGPQQVDITLTLKDGTVSSAEFISKAKGEMSIKMQGKFKKGFKEKVVGKPVDEIALTVVNGSSLTSKGFMDALKKIKQEAQQS